MATNAPIWPSAPVPEPALPETALEALQEPVAPAAPPTPRAETETETSTGTGWMALAVRWTVLVGATAWAFHATLWSLCTQTYNGDPLAYLLLMPYWVALLAASTHLRRGRELDIHDRQMDWIAAIGTLVLFALVARLLVPRLGPTAGMVRADVYCLLLFLLAGCVLLFGARTVGRYWTAWLFAFACWPLLYQLAGAALGGTVLVYSLLNVAISAVVAGLAAGGRIRLRALAAGVALGVGVALALLATALPATLAELLPAALAPVAPLAVLLPRRFKARAEATGRGTNPVKKPAAAMVFLLAVAALIGWGSSAAPASLVASSLPRAAAHWTPTTPAPAGWTKTASRSYDWAPRYFGTGASWQRATYTPAGGGQPLVVDGLTTAQTGPLGVYPTVSCYRLASPYVEGAHTVPLGHGVHAQLFYANLSTAATPTDAAWVLLTWTWRIGAGSASSFQRVTVLGLDGNATRLAIPAPAAPFSSGTVRSTFTDVLRGVQSSASAQPSDHTMAELRHFAAAIVRNRGR